MIKIIYSQEDKMNRISINHINDNPETWRTLFLKIVKI